MSSLLYKLQMIRATNLRYCVCQFLGAKGYYNKDSDEQYLQRLYKCFYGKKINFEEPKTFSEKMQWLKVYYHNPRLTQMVDKYDVKQYVIEKLGKSHVIPCLGVWEKPEDIDYDSLPDSFVLKATHDSGGFKVIENKETCDIDGINSYFSQRLQRNYFYGSREWQYKNVKPRIIAEPYIENLGKSDSIEYKLTCIHGKVEFITVCGGIAHNRLDYRTNDFYDRDLNKLDMVTNYYKNSGKTHLFPKCIKEMIEAAELLSSEFPTARVDFYVMGDDYIFGEITFYTWGGFFNFTPKHWNQTLGEKLHLPKAIN